MEEQAEILANGAAPELKKNAGWFRHGDSRINREGRPLGRPEVVSGVSLPQELATRADRLMVLVLGARELLRRLSYGEHRWWDQDSSVRFDAPGNIRRWVTNFPDDCEIVRSRLDETWAFDGKVVPRVVIVLRSKQFPRVAKGAVIPQFKPQFNIPA